MQPIPGFLLLLVSLTVPIACSSTTSSQSRDASAIGADASPVEATSQAPATSTSTIATAPGAPAGAVSDTKGSGESPAPSPNAERPTAAPSPPTSPQAVLADLYDRQSALGICPDGFDAAISPSGSIVYPIGDNQYLVQMMCFMAAYQGSYEYLIYTTTAGEPQVKALKLARFQAGENGQLSMLEEQQVGGLPEYNPGQQQLTILTKFSGGGTCGSLATYQVQGDQLQLVEYRAKFECDETFVDPAQYPQVFP
ncbi:DUF1176 domain-containing protein [Trichothermofontia sp.]